MKGGIGLIPYKSAFIRMRRKIIDDCCLYYLNDLFGIKLICLRSELNVATFWLCMDSTFFGMSCFKPFSPYRRRDRSKISSDQKRLFMAVSLYPLSFFANTPFKNKHTSNMVLYARRFSLLKTIKFIFLVCVLYYIGSIFFHHLSSRNLLHELYVINVK